MMCFVVHLKQTLQEYVDRVLESAHMDLIKFPLKPILKALKEHPDGVKSEYFKDQTFTWKSGPATEVFDLSCPESVGLAMKSQNCIMFRIELNLYQLQSTAHKTAIKNLEF